MKKQSINTKLLSIVLFILSGFLVVLSASDKEKSFSVSKGDKLEVSAFNGNVNISIWTKDQAYINAINIDEDDLNDLKIEQIGNKILVDFKGQDSDDFYLEISIPAHLNLDISTGAGNIPINGNINGKVEIATGGGNINLKDVGDKLSVSTGGGNISVGSVSGETELSTGGGDVSILAALKKLEVSSGGGNISISSIGGNGEISTGGGNVSVGNVSGGIEISSGGGNIKLDGANGKVEASTGGGNVTLKNIKGSVEATSGSGNIELELDPQIGTYSEITTGNGNITLYISENTKATINANFLVWKHNKDKNPTIHLVSDFDGVTYDLNENKREMNAVLKLNGGGSTIELNVSSDEIFIKKR